jgi:uncharacterized protein (DUF1778 family)
MARNIAKSKGERLETRISPDQKTLFQRAADLAGRSLTDFVVSSVQEAAEREVRAHQVLELTARETEAFFEAIQNPPPPGERLRAAARQHQQQVSVDW